MVIAYKTFYTMRETVDRAPAKIGRDHEIEGSTPSLFLFSFFERRIANGKRI